MHGKYKAGNQGVIKEMNEIINRIDSGKASLEDEFRLLELDHELHKIRIIRH